MVFSGRAVVPLQVPAISLAVRGCSATAGADNNSQQIKTIKIERRDVYKRQAYSRTYDKTDRGNDQKIPGGLR